MRILATTLGLPLAGLLWLGTPVAAAQETAPEERAAAVEPEDRLAPVSAERDSNAAPAATGDQLVPVSPAGELWPPIAIEGDQLVTTVRVGLPTSRVMDLSTTTYGIGTGVVKEANPFMRWAADDPLTLTAVKLGTAAGLDWTVRKLAKGGHRKTAIVLGVAITVTTMAVSVHNLHEIRGAQR